MARLGGLVHRPESCSIGTVKSPILSIALLATALPACGETFPLPPEFDAAFSTGRICTPSTVATGPTATYPVRFELCAYRCIDVDRPTAKVYTAFTCTAGICQMIMLAYAHVIRDDTQEGCDARDLENPPPGECTTETFDFNLGVPLVGEPPMPSTGPFTVNVPYLNLDQGQELIDRLEAMQEDPIEVVRDVVGFQMHPQRQFVINFDTNATPLMHSDLTEADCKTITAP